ncbi:hypothetical protein GGI22_007508, partial [Coemansia erecta]
MPEVSELANVAGHSEKNGSLPHVSTEAQSVAAATDTAKEDGPNKGSKRNRGQTGKDRRVFARKKFRERKDEQDEGRREQRQPNADRTEPRLPKRKVALLMGFCGTG